MVLSTRHSIARTIYESSINPVLLVTKSLCLIQGERYGNQMQRYYKGLGHQRRLQVQSLLLRQWSKTELLVQNFTQLGQCLTTNQMLHDVCTPYKFLEKTQEAYCAVGYNRWLFSKAPESTERAIDAHSVASLKTPSFRKKAIVWLKL